MDLSTPPIRYIHVDCGREVSYVRTRVTPSLHVGDEYRCWPCKFVFYVMRGEDAAHFVNFGLRPLREREPDRIGRPLVCPTCGGRLGYRGRHELLRAPSAPFLFECVDCGATIRCGKL